MGTRGQWSLDFLKALGNSSPDKATQNLVAAWTVGEDTEARFNPLATTLNYGTNTKFNNCCGGNGVKNYSTRDEGIQASVLTLRGKSEGYSDIVRGLTTSDPELALKGMKRSPWGTNFAHVELVWRSRDVRNELLKSEASTPPKIAGGMGHNPEPIKPDIPNNGISDPSRNDTPSFGVGGGGGGSWDDKPSNGAVTADSVKNTFKIILGIGMLGMALILIVNVAMKTDAAQTALAVASKGII